MARPVRYKNVQHLGRADAVDDFDAGAFLEALADVLGESFARRCAEPETLGPCPPGQLWAGQHRGKQCRDATEDRRVVRAHRGDNAVGRRTVRKQDGGGTGRHRERHAIAKSVGEEQLGGGENDVAGRDAKNALGEQFCGRHQAGVQMPRALGHTRRARGIEPECHLIGAGIGSFRHRLTGCDECIQFEYTRIGSGTRDSDMQMPLCSDGVEHRRRALVELARDDHGIGASVLDHVRQGLVRQQRVQRHRHDAGLDGSPEHDGKIDRVEHDQRNPPLARDAEPRQHIGEAIAGFGKRRIGQLPFGIDEGNLGAQPLGDVAIDHVDRGVVGAGCWRPGRGWFSTRHAVLPSR